MQLHITTNDGVPIYLQIVNQIKYLVASGRLSAGDELPPIRALAEQIVVNPNTVARAYRELELGGMLETHQGTGTFVAKKKPEKNNAERERQLTQMAGEFAARAGAAGFTVEDLLERLREMVPDRGQRR